MRKIGRGLISFLTGLLLLLPFFASHASASEITVSEYAPPVSYNVSIGWENMTFDYSTRWNPDTHSYEPWSAYGGKVYVTNVSDYGAPVTVTLSFLPGANVGAVMTPPYDMASPYTQFTNGIEFTLPYEDASGALHSTAYVDVALCGSGLLTGSDGDLAYAGKISVDFTPLPFDPPVVAGPTPEPTAEPTPEPTAEPTPESTAEPAPESTAEPAPEPTAEPAPEPTAEPAPEPTAEPAPESTAEPAPEPTAEPAPESTAESTV